METYSWKAGVMFPVKAEVAADTIKNLQASLGKESITAKELLDASRDENAPLHDCFEWDDSVAAEKFRQEQARRLINGIETVIIAKEPIRTKLFVNIRPVKPAQEGGYVTIHQAMVVDDWKRQVLENALKELLSFKKKYAIYSELTGVFAAINDFKDTLDAG